ncbi:hypothetical protein OXYTRIMIC_466 [Oxytricha trifallax]|uniref:HTH CENPB-type domain-containing protein n=1 Tax=Oxytricha trifallax TaxID=1172189 RepID=A0A073I0J9_9SPIT|nr:hypothetical protein OXYTRIMIC_466 [Oxytricha trifallax]
MLDANQKHQAILLAQSLPLKQVADKFGVPVKSLKRWLKVGHERKKGGGRKTKDPVMEGKLYKWFIEQKSRGEVVSAKKLKSKAKELSEYPEEFYASKGWLDKFKNRYGLEVTKEEGVLKNQDRDGDDDGKDKYKQSGSGKNKRNEGQNQDKERNITDAEVNKIEDVDEDMEMIDIKNEMQDDDDDDLGINQIYKMNYIQIIINAKQLQFF